MFTRLLFIVLYVICELANNNAHNYRKCNPYNGRPDCPGLTICTQNETESKTGECKCESAYVFNPAHNENATDYCIRNPNASPTSGSSTTANGAKTASAISQNEPPGSHHLIGGILIPVILVSIVLGLVFLAKRLNLVRRAREMFSTRRNRPFYEDVMMSNDNDDPPLI